MGFLTDEQLEEYLGYFVSPKLIAKYHGLEVQYVRNRIFRLCQQQQSSPERSLQKEVPHKVQKE